MGCRTCSRPRFALRLFAAACSVLACEQVLNIDQAHVDPTLMPGGQGGSLQVGDPASGGASQGAGNQAQAGEGNDQDTLCEQYCGDVSQYCAGSALQYRDAQQCLAVCELLPAGKLGGADANTVACRLKYAGKARYAGGSELTAYCREAGPGGDERCGSNCEGLCTIVMATCTPEVTSPYYYPNFAACISDCQSLSHVPYAYADQAVADSDTAECRLFHAISAVMMDPEEHCQHALGVTLCEAKSTSGSESQR